MTTEALPSRAQVMKWWDQWRTYIAEGGVGSYPRDAFESLLDTYDEALAAKPAGAPREPSTSMKAAAYKALDSIDINDRPPARSIIMLWQAMHDEWTKNVPQSTARDDVVEAACAIVLENGYSVKLDDLNRLGNAVRALTSNDGTNAA